MCKPSVRVKENPSTKGEESVTVGKGDVEVSEGDEVVVEVIAVVVQLFDSHVANESHSRPKG